jgi:hypothetical protein
METFDYAWRYVKDSVPGGQVDPVAWQKVYDELLPAREGADSPDELRPVLSDMLRSLGQSHYTVLSGGVNDALAEVLAQSPQAHSGGRRIRASTCGSSITAPSSRTCTSSRRSSSATRSSRSRARPSHRGFARLEDGVDDAWLAGAYTRYVVVQAMAAPPGERVSVVVERGADTRTLDVTTTRRSSCRARARGPEPCTRKRGCSPRASATCCSITFLVPVMDRFVSALGELRTSGASRS